MTLGTTLRDVRDDQLRSPTSHQFSGTDVWQLLQHAGHCARRRAVPGVAALRGRSTHVDLRRDAPRRERSRGRDCTIVACVPVIAS